MISNDLKLPKVTYSDSKWLKKTQNDCKQNVVEKKIAQNDSEWLKIQNELKWFKMT